MLKTIIFTISVLFLTEVTYSEAFSPSFKIEPSYSHKYFFYYKIYDQSSPQLYFIIYDPVSNSTVTYDKDFFRTAVLNSGLEDYGTLLRVNTIGFDFKENVIPYINPLAAVKLFSVLEHLGKELRITDIFRTDAQQQIYKRRNWSPLEVSPHQLGLAVDIPPYLLVNPSLAEVLCHQLNVRYLVHGFKGNRHLHINDISLWTAIKPDEISGISADLCSQIPNECCSQLFGLKNADVSFEYGQKIISAPLSVNIITDKLTSISIKITDVYNQKIADIFCGSFETGQNNLTMDLSFLKKGNYFIEFMIDKTIFKNIYYYVN